MKKAKSEKRAKILTATISALMLISLISVFQAGTASAQTEVWVAPPPTGDDTNPGTEAEPFATIQKGIDTVAEGGTVNVAPGTYSLGEGYTISKELTIRASGAVSETILDVGSKNIGLESAVTLEGFTVTTTSTTLAISIHEYSTGTHVINNVLGRKIKIGNYCSDIIVQGNIIDGGNIYMTIGLSDILIKGNKVSNCTSGAGINMQPSTSHPNSNVTVEGNEVTNCSVGGIHQLQGFTSGLTIKGNKVFNLDPGGWGGITVTDGSDITIKGNRVYNILKGVGIWVFDGSNITIENNEVHDCTDAVAYGYGISVGGQTITIRYNEVYNNAITGISVRTGATGVVINYNNIYGNPEYGLKNKATDLVDATLNWWGRPDIVGIIKGTEGNINADPWLSAQYPSEELVTSKGEKGETGDKGELGLPGDDGEKGDKGDTGATGATGATGPKGDTGATGATGATGFKGDTGPMGSQGPAGSAGTVPLEVPIIAVIAMVVIVLMLAVAVRRK